MRKLKTFTDAKGKKGKIGSKVKIVDTNFLYYTTELKVVSEIQHHGGNGVYLIFKGESSLEGIGAKHVQIK